MRISLSCLALAVVATFACSVKAQPVQVSFTGEVLVTSSDGVNRAPAIVDGVQISEMDAVTGTVQYNPSASPDLVDGTTGAIYNGLTPSFLNLTINGVQFSNDGQFALIVTNDNPGGGGPTDGFFVQDGFDPNAEFGGFGGNTILINNQVSNAIAEFMSLTDLDAEVYNSLDLPSEFDLANFDLLAGSVGGDDPSGRAFSAIFTIDSISVVSVPEPNSSLFAMGVVMGLLCKRRRLA